MEQTTDVRWLQRYANFHKACKRLLEVTLDDRFMDDLFSHVCDENEVLSIVRLIYNDYAPLLNKLDKDLAQLSQQDDYRQV